MSVFPRLLLSERTCKGCGCTFARLPNTDVKYDPERCGFCLAQLAEPQDEARAA